MSRGTRPSLGLCTWSSSLKSQPFRYPLVEQAPSLDTAVRLYLVLSQNIGGRTTLLSFYYLHSHLTKSMSSSAITLIIRSQVPFCILTFECIISPGGGNRASEPFYHLNEVLRRTGAISIRNQMFQHSYSQLAELGLQLEQVQATRLRPSLLDLEGDARTSWRPCPTDGRNRPTLLILFFLLATPQTLNVSPNRLQRLSRG